MPFLPFGPLPYLKRSMLIGAVLPIVLLVAAFWRMGRGRWWTTWPGGAGKALAVVVLTQIAGLVGMVPVLAIGALGGLYGS